MSDEAPSEQRTSNAAVGAIGAWRLMSPAAKALLLGVFVNRLGAFLQIFLVLFLTNQGFSGRQAGLALGVYGAGSVLGNFIGGWLSDRLSPRGATLISMLGSAGLIVSILYLQIYPLILVAVLLVGSIGQLNRPAAQAMLADLTPPERLVMTMAMWRLAQNLATAATPMVGVALVSISYDLLFWAEAAAAIIYSVIAWRLLPGKVPEAQEANAGGEDRQGYGAVLRDVRYVFYLAAVLLVTVVYVQYISVLPLAIKANGMSLWWYSTVVSANAVIVALLEVPATKYVQTWPLRLTAIAGFGLVAIGYGIYAVDLVPVLLILGTMVWTASEIIGAPTTFAYPGLVAPPHLRGRYSGAMLGVFGLGTAIGPAVGAAVWEQIGDSFWIWAALVAALSAVCARIGMRIPEKEPKAEPATAPKPEPDTTTPRAEPAS